MAEELVKCPKCKEDIAKGASKCKHCGADLRNWFVRHKVLSAILVFFVLIVLVNALGGSNTSTSTTKVGNTQETKYKVGDVIKTDKFEITITSVEERGSVGSEFFLKNPSQGGTYLAVQYSFKNISSSPIGAFSQPSLKLADSKGVKYDNDISASSNFATELKLDSKILSDLNPGITVTNADVFEVNKDLYTTGTWDLIITADKEYKVTVK